MLAEVQKIEIFRKKQRLFFNHCAIDWDILTPSQIKPF